jgi:Cu-Zn family superoxide dismutase
MGVRTRQALAGTVIGVALALAATRSTESFGMSGPGQGSTGRPGEAQPTATARLKPSLSATIRPTLNNVTGVVTFTQSGGRVTVVALVRGLTPSTKHGFHIHEVGDLSAPDLMSAGGHYNPDGHEHGGPGSQSHAGDFGSLESDAKGVAILRLTVDNIAIAGADNNVIGLAMIVHAWPDDLTSQPAGNAGDRIAGGIIEL